MASLTNAIVWKKFKLPAGATTKQIEVAIGSVGKGKPVGLLIAGLHGDEAPWGTWAIRKFMDRVRTNQLRGTLRVVAAANPSGEEVGKRNAALDLIPMDLNRTFPGDMHGLHTERLAAIISKYAVAGADVVVDVHGGGNWCVNSFVAQFPGSEDLADAVGAPFITPREPASNTLTGYAHANRAKVVLLEMGGIGAEEETWADRVADGIERVLNVGKVIVTRKRAAAKSVVVGPSEVLRPSRGGIYLPALREKYAGRIVPKETVLGHLLDPVTFDIVETYRAPYPETAMLLLRPTLIHVEGGTPLMIVAEPKREDARRKKAVKRRR